jgi:hypothetical protein
MKNDSTARLTCLTKNQQTYNVEKRRGNISILFRFPCSLPIHSVLLWQIVKHPAVEKNHKFLLSLDFMARHFMASFQVH